MLSNKDIFESLSKYVPEQEFDNVQWQIDYFEQEDYSKPNFSLSQLADKPIYPASVCKLFYLVACLRFVEQEKVSLGAEDERALSDMILHSSNEATVYLLGRLTETKNGPVLGEGDMLTWWHKRQEVDRFFKTLNLSGYEGCQLLHGTYEFSPYGRENFVRQYGRNLLSPLVCNQLMIALLNGNILSPEHAEKCWSLLNRTWERGLTDQVLEESQIKSFLAEQLPEHVRVWSKAGWTSDTRHDCAVLRKGKKTLVATVMSQGEGLAGNNRWLPAFGLRLNECFFS